MLSQPQNFSASIGSFQRLPAETSEVILLPQRLALKYNTTPLPPCQHFLTGFFIFFLVLLKKVHFLVFNVLFLRKKAACAFLHRRPYITSIIKLADLDAKLELQVAEDLLDHALHFLSGNFLFRIGQRQGERHALLTLAQICAAVDIEQLDLTHQRAGLLDGLLDLARSTMPSP